MIEAPKVRMRKTIKVKMLKSKIYEESDSDGDDGEDGKPRLGEVRCFLDVLDTRNLT